MLHAIKDAGDIWRAQSATDNRDRPLTAQGGRVALMLGETLRWGNFAKQSS